MHIKLFFFTKVSPVLLSILFTLTVNTKFMWATVNEIVAINFEYKL